MAPIKYNQHKLQKKQNSKSIKGENPFTKNYFLKKIKTVFQSKN